MLIVELFLEMNGLTDVQQTIQQPQHVKFWTSQKKLDWLLTTIEPITDAIFKPFAAPNNAGITLKIVLEDGVDHTVTLPSEMAGKTCECHIGSVKVKIHVPGQDESIDKVDDDLYNYNMAFVRSMIDFMALQDCIKYGDIDKLTIIIKRLIPLFAGLHSFRSKYMIEMINFLTKTEYVLSPKESTCVKLRAFVNPTGREGHNKPADLQQENNIKAVKNVVKGLGAGQTDTALVRASEAAPSINAINENFKLSLGMNSGSFSKKHSKDDTEDKAACMNVLRAIRPFQIQQKRFCGLLKPISESIIHSVDKSVLNSSIIRNATRASSKHHVVDLDDTEVEV